MRCHHCDTPLWKVRARECPSCGSPFKPSGFRFRPQTVRFCCPHCGQGYLGNGPDGLPEPRRFECVFCGRWINADEMVLELAEGVEEHETKPDTLPWVETHRPRLMRWALTAWLGWRDPVRLVGLTPAGLGIRPAVNYALVTLLGGAVLLPAAAWVVGVLLSLPGGSRAFGALSLGGVLLLVGLLAMTVVFAAGWVAVVQAVGRRGGRGAPAVSAVRLLCLTCAPQVLWFVPVLGVWVGWLGTLAWARAVTRGLPVSHGFARRSARVGGLAWPVGCVLVWGAVTLGGELGVLPGWGGGRAVWVADAGESVSRFDAPIRALLEKGRTPRHPAELLADASVPPDAFCARSSLTTPAGIEISGTTLSEFGQLAPARQLAVIQQAAGMVSPDEPAQRLGDFVFIFDVLGASEPDLWLVVEALDPAHNPSDRSVHVLHLDGSVRTVLPGDVARVLLEQNRLRTGLGLLALGDPRRVRGQSTPDG